MARPDELDFADYGDHVHRVHAPRKLRGGALSKYPPRCVRAEEQRAWYDMTLERSIRFTLNRMICEERANIEGVLVQRTDAYDRYTFHIGTMASANGTLYRYSVEESVSIILRLVSKGVK